MDPGTYIAIAEIAFRSAYFAIKTFRNDLHYNRDAERLVVNLEMERFRLQIWGENSGLIAPHGRHPTLPDRLVPLCAILRSHLDTIRDLVQNADELRDRYGLDASTDAAPTTSAPVRRLVERMQRSMRASGIKLEDPKDPHVESSEDATVSRQRPDAWNRIRWAVHDLKKFDSLVTDVAAQITKLNQLLTESQQKKAREDRDRVEIAFAESAVDPESLDLLVAAVKDEDVMSTLRALVERKALSSDLPWLPRTAIATPSPSMLSDFLLPNDISRIQRIVTRKHTDSDTAYLLERKSFDPDIHPDEKKMLTERMQRLVMLLSKPKSPTFKTPLAVACIHDPSRFCWWIVSRLESASPPSALSGLSRPVSLLSLLQPQSKIKPPLEQRYALASAICTTFSELYSSSWLHKSVRSENIIFDADPLPTPTPTSGDMKRILSRMLVCGFDYSRQESEGSTIDRAKASGDVLTAIYRHPDYQGEAAQGYKIQHDIYSLGLVLLEIALWVPLATFLDGKPTGGNKLSSASDPTVQLSSKMEFFFAPHAFALKRRVLAKVENEFAFRIGSPYYAAVKSCLKFSDEEMPVDPGHIRVHPALDFYNSVVVPLRRLAEAHN